MKGRARTNPIKLVFVGDSGVGKTCLIQTFQKGEFPSEYICAVLDPFKASVKLMNQEYPIEIIDTPGRNEFKEMRVELYEGADIVVICCSVVDPKQWDNLNTWKSEIMEFCPSARYVLAGLKTDLRTDETVTNALIHSDMIPVTESKGLEKAHEIDAYAYYECSSLLNVGVRDIMLESAYLKFKKPADEGGCCNVM